MSAQDRQPQDPVLRYAPPRVRQQARRDEVSAKPPEQRDAHSDVNSGEDRVIIDVQRRLSLEPELLPQPPSFFYRHNTWMTTTLRAACLLALASISAWLAVSTPLLQILGSQFLGTRFLDRRHEYNVAMPLSRPTQDGQTILKRALEAEQNRAVPIEPPLNGSDPVETVSSEPVLPVEDFVVPSNDAGINGRLVNMATNASAPRALSEPPAAPAAPDFVTRRLEREELVSLLERADVFIKSGDLSAARLLLQRAAEAGDALAAFTLASTLDPNVLKVLGLRDGAPDVAMARLWYERAAKLGSADAPRRLQQLATTSAD
jgi:hypothetical protein